MIHLPVLLDEVLEALKWQSPGLVVGDFTVGGGGHLEALLKANPPPARVIALDQDAYAIGRAKQKLEKWGSVVEFREMNFRNAANSRLGTFDRILIDLGVSSFQLDDPKRGFSFQKKGPLDLRMNASAGISASEWLQSVSDDEFVDVLRSYGEESRARYFLKRLREAQRRNLALETTEDFVQALGFELDSKDRKGRHPLTQVFQALRIQVNDELSSLEDFLRAASNLLNPGGRLGIISFHSLEDRRVKWAFREDENLKELTRRPIVAGESELKTNPRSRSAKLRVAEKK